MNQPQSYIQYLNIKPSMFLYQLNGHEQMLKARAKQEHKRMTYAERKDAGLIRKFN